MSARAKFVVAILVTMLAGGSRAFAERILPDSCGSDKIQFDVKTQKDAPTPAPPTEGKARIVFVQTKTQKGSAALFGIFDFTTRFGVDGTWLGAAANNSHFTADIAPGEHHVCASVQNTKKGAKDMIGMAKFTAEAGKTYYFKLAVTKISDRENYYSSDFGAIDEDEGKFEAKSLPLSLFTARAGK